MVEDYTDFMPLCHFLNREERLELFDMLCDTVEKRIPERVGMILEIKRTNVYPYMKERGEKRLVPNDETTLKIIDALRKRGHNQRVWSILRIAFGRMKRATAKIQVWMKQREKMNSPLWGLKSIERSLSPSRMYF